jgi:hypothetical protein
VTNGTPRDEKNLFQRGRVSYSARAAGIPISGTPPGWRFGLFSEPKALRLSACRSKPYLFLLTKCAVP